MLVNLAGPPIANKVELDYKGSKNSDNWKEFLIILEEYKVLLGTQEMC